MAWRDDEVEIRDQIKAVQRQANTTDEALATLTEYSAVTRLIAEKVEPLRIRVDDLEARVAALEG